MSESEIFAQVLSVLLGIPIWMIWVYQILAVSGRVSRVQERALLLIAPAVSLAVLYWILQSYAASDVQGSRIYLAFYMSLGAVWLGAGTRVLSLFGLSARDDAVERGNRAAAYAVSGALLGITLCFAGGNIGDGPGWWVVIFCALLSTGALFLLWSFLDRATRLADTVTVDRDPSAGLRLAGFFIGTGLILGRAVAGDWESAAGTLVDFLTVGWPALVLWAVAVWMERSFRPSPEVPTRPLFSAGLLPALLYAGLGAAAVVLAGPWS